MAGDNKSGDKKEYLKSLESNIWKYGIFQILRNAAFASPIVALFYMSNGLSMKEVMLVESVFALTVVLLEVPTGYFADRFGRRFSMIMGGIILFLAAAIMAMSEGFYGFLISEIVWGVGYTFCSGADTALLYDTLKELKKKEDYKKKEGHAFFLGRFSESVSSIIGGIIAVVSMRITLWAMAAAFLLMALLSASFIEPRRHAVLKGSSHIVRMYKVLRFALHRNKVVKWLILYSSVISLFGLVTFWFSQPYMKDAGLPIAYFGLVFALFGVVRGLAGKYSYRYEKLFGLRAAVISLPIISMVSMFFIGRWMSIFSFILFFLLIEFVDGIEFPLTSDLINKIVWPENRATILSICSLVGRLMFTVFAPIFGWLSDIYGMTLTFYVCSASMLVLGGITLMMMHRHNAV